MIPHLRVRLTAIYGGIFVVFVAVLLSISYWLMSRHLDRTLDPFEASAALGQLRMQYLMALAGASLVATALGWALAGRELGSMQAAFDARERFVANASHELRSPLTVIRTPTRPSPSCARWVARSSARRTRWMRCSKG